MSSSFILPLFLALASLLVVALLYLAIRSRHGHLVAFALAGLSLLTAFYSFTQAMSASSGGFFPLLVGFMFFGAIGLIFLLIGLLRLRRRG